MMTVVDAGSFREQVAVQAFTTTPDDAGGYTETWADVAAWSQLFAEIEPLTGNEQLRAMQAEASGTHRVRMWALEGLKSTAHRIRRNRDGGVMELVAPPAYDPTRLQMELLVREVET